MKIYILSLALMVTCCGAQDTPPPTIITTQYVGWPLTNVVPKLTNSSLAHPERKRRVMAYRKECPECGVMLTSTNITTWSVNDDTNSFRMVSVQFECRGCEETYLETFKRPIRKTKVEELTVEVVK